MSFHNLLMNVIVDYSIPIIVGILLLIAYRLHPERFPQRWGRGYVLFLAVVVILDSVLPAIWDTFRQSH